MRRYLSTLDTIDILCLLFPCIEFAHSEHKMSIVSEINKNCRIWTRNIHTSHGGLTPQHYERIMIVLVARQKLIFPSNLTFLACARLEPKGAMENS